MIVNIANRLFVGFTISVRMSLQDANQHDPSYAERTAAKWISL